MLFLLLRLCCVFWTQISWYLQHRWYLSFCSDCFSYLGSFVLHMNFRVFFSVNNVIGILKVVSMNLQITFSKIDILTILIMLIHEHRSSSIIFFRPL
jgi:hypothetical protein